MPVKLYTCVVTVSSLTYTAHIHPAFTTTATLRPAIGLSNILNTFFSAIATTILLQAPLSVADYAHSENSQESPLIMILPASG